MTWDGHPILTSVRSNIYWNEREVSAKDFSTMGSPLSLFVFDKLFFQIYFCLRMSDRGTASLSICLQGHLGAP